MKKSLTALSGLLSLSMLILVCCASASAAPGITLIGKGMIEGNRLDSSGLTGNICQASLPTNCVPKSIYGGFGSDLAYTGHGNIFVAAPDRGPFDGLTDVPYVDRLYYLYIDTNPALPFPNISVKLRGTKILRNQFGKTFLGAAGEFSLFGDFSTLRFDPEGIRVGPDETIFISDEYGPYLFEFDPEGRLLQRLSVPTKYAIASPSADPTAELLGNVSGRQANRGMEGLAISPDGGTLYGIMQNALLQDNGLTPGTVDRFGLNNRILKINRATGQTSEYVYVLEAINRGQGVSDILAINDHEFLVIERDNRSNLQTPPQAPTRKNIYKIDITGATDVSAVNSLPAGTLPASITPARKTSFINLLDTEYALAATIPEKIEGLAWGPDLPDGRHVLYVISDNDLNPSLATQIYAFAIDPTIVGYLPQFLPSPIFKPGKNSKPKNSLMERYYRDDTSWLSQRK